MTTDAGVRGRIKVWVKGRNRHILLLLAELWIAYFAAFCKTQLVILTLYYFAVCVYVCMCMCPFV